MRGRRIDAYHTLTYPALPTQTRPALPYRTVPYRTVPYRTLPYLILPCPVLPYPTLPYPTLSYPSALTVMRNEGLPDRRPHHLPYPSLCAYRDAY